MTDSNHPSQFDVVLCDIDGCLSPEGPEPMDMESLARIADHNARALRLTEEGGGRLPMVTFCSGRPQPFVEAMCKMLRNTTVPAIAENGVWLYHPGTNEYLMDPRITPEYLDQVHEARRWIQSEFAGSGLTIQPGKTASISLYHPDTTFLHSIEDRLRDTFDRRGWRLRVSMTWLYINCDLEFVSKGTGITRFFDLKVFFPERSAGIGDTPSDEAIRERVAWFGCPANAHVSLRTNADYVARQSEAAGVVEILEQLS